MDFRIQPRRLRPGSRERALAEKVAKAFRDIDPTLAGGPLQVSRLDISTYFADRHGAETDLIDSTKKSILRAQERLLGRTRTLAHERTALDADRAVVEKALHQLAERLGGAIPRDVLLELVPLHPAVLRRRCRGLCALLESLAAPMSSQWRALETAGSDLASLEALSRTLLAHLARVKPGHPELPWVSLPLLTSAFAQLVRAVAQEMRPEMSRAAVLAIWQIWRCTDALSQTCAELARGTTGEALNGLLSAVKVLSLAGTRLNQLGAHLTAHMKVVNQAAAVQDVMPDIGRAMDQLELGSQLEAQLKEVPEMLSDLATCLDVVFNPGTSGGSPVYGTS
jgi:hypothetical protein